LSNQATREWELSSTISADPSIPEDSYRHPQIYSEQVVIRPPFTPVDTSGMHKELPCRICAYFLLAVAGNPIRSTIIPLTVEALEIVLADLKGGRGQGMRLTLPNHGFLPFISVPHETSAKMIRTYTGRAIDPQALENDESN